jgi:hypothetical protein
VTAAAPGGLMPNENNIFASGTTLYIAKYNARAITNVARVTPISTSADRIKLQRIADGVPPRGRLMRMHCGHQTKDTMNSDSIDHSGPI